MKKILILFGFFFILLTIPLYSSKAMITNDAAQSAAKEWTFLVFLNGNNNLDPHGKANIEQMKQVGSTEEINVVVQWASLERGKTERILITKETDIQQSSAAAIHDMGSVDMGSWESLVDFVRWGVENYPAKHYFLDLWDHGSGWHAVKMVFNIEAMSLFPLNISWDEKSRNHMTTHQLGMALEESSKIIGHKIDLYGSDACMMAMAEIADQVENAVQIFVGSEEIEPGSGWPYHTFLQRWTNQPYSSAVEVSKMLTEEYIKSYIELSSKRVGVTFSAFNLEKMNLLNDSITHLKNGLIGLGTSARLKLLSAAKKAQGFTYSDYKDLLDFINLLESAQIENLDKKVTEDVRNAIQEFVVINQTTPQLSRAHGLSIWLPTYSSTYEMNSDRYKTLNFHKHTQWGDFIEFLLD